MLLILLYTKFYLCPRFIKHFLEPDFAKKSECNIDNPLFKERFSICIKMSQNKLLQSANKSWYNKNVTRLIKQSGNNVVRSHMTVSAS